MNRREIFAKIASLCAVLRLDGFNPPKMLQSQSLNAKDFALRKFVMPMYPHLARQVGIEGKVVALATLSPDGLVTSAISVSGHPLLAQEVIDCLKEWQFEALESQIRQEKIEFNFLLKGERAERIVHYRISGNTPDNFEVETNPAPNMHP
jgi:TonB family protein